MTEQLRTLLKEHNGQFKGVVAYLQLRELLVFNDFMTEEQEEVIPLNVLRQIATLSDDEWSLLLLKYGRETTRYQVMSPDELRNVRGHIITSIQ